MKRAVLLALAVVVAVVLQVSVFSRLAWHGVGPDLCLLVVVAAGLARDERFAMLAGFAGGLVLDLAPPADHVAGRWALALTLVGYLAGRARQEQRPSRLSVLVLAGACSLVGSSVFALTGLLVGELGGGVAGALPVVLTAAAWDLALALVVVPPLARLLGDARPAPLERLTPRQVVS